MTFVNIMRALMSYAEGLALHIGVVLVAKIAEIVEKRMPTGYLSTPICGASSSHTLFMTLINKSKDCSLRWRG